MVYVDLNPIRAGLCLTLEDSEFTSIQARLAAYKSRKREVQDSTWLKPMHDTTIQSTALPLPIEAETYFALVDWTGRAIRTDKRGAIPESAQPILAKLGVNAENWVSNTQYFGSRFRRVAGSIARMKSLLRRTRGKWFSGQSQAQQFYR